MKCRLCHAELDPDKAKCKKCGAWTNAAPIEKNESTDPNVEADGTVTLDKVTSAERDRIHTGLGLDKTFGGGIVRTGVTMLGGLPGAGKTTMLLQLAGRLATVTGLETLYIAAEQHLPEIRMIADRIESENRARVRMLQAMGGAVNINAVLEKRIFGAMILDSLQGLANDDHEVSMDMLVALKDYAVAKQAPAIVICQVTKGEELAGLMKFQHKVDTLMMLAPEDADDEENDIRCMSAQKNRFGPAFSASETYYAMTAKGLIYLPNGPIDHEEDDEEENDEEE